MLALLGAAAFFFLERGNVPPSWHTNVTLAGIVCLVAGISYFYMQGMYLTTGLTPTGFRYADWLFTAPLMCTQFYLLMRTAGAKLGSLYRLLLGSIWMVTFGYIGETRNTHWSIVWGAVSTLGYLLILYEVWFGSLAKLADKALEADVIGAFTYLSYFILIGWAIYPLGYMTQPFNVFGTLHLNRDLVYNFGDVFNKLGFGIVIYTMARKAAQLNESRWQQAQHQLETLA
jgi:bacteriorhodopsin